MTPSMASVTALILGMASLRRMARGENYKPPADHDPAPHFVTVTWLVNATINRRKGDVSMESRVKTACVIGVCAVCLLHGAASRSFAQDRLPPIPPDKQTEAQKKAA